MHLDGDLTITLGAGSGYVGSIKIDSIDLADNTLTFGGGAGTIGPHIEIYNLNSTISPATSLIKTTDVGAASINIGKIDDSSITFQDFNFVKYEEGNEVLGINNTSLTRVFWRTPTTLNNVCSSIDEMQTLIDAGFKEIYIQPGSTYSGEVVIPYGTNFRIKSIVNDGLALSGDFRLLMGTGTGYSGSITIESLDLDGYTFGLSSVTGGYGPDAEIYTVKGGGTIETDSYVSSPAGVYIGKVLGSAITSQNINMMYEEAENPIVKIGVDALEQVFWRTPQGGGGMLQDLSQVLMEGNDAGGQDIVNAGAISVGLSVPDASMSIVTQSGSVRNVWGYTHDYVSGLTGTRYQSEFGASSGNTYFGISSFIDGGSNYGDMVFNTGGGNVGIGKTPSDKFDVNGVILSQATNTNIDSAGVKAVPTTEWVKAQYDHAHPFGRAGSNSMPNNTDVDLPFIWYDENIAGSWGWDGQGPNPDRTLDAVADGIIIGFSVKASTLDSDVTFGFKINGVKDATTWTLTSATKKLVQLGTNVAFTAGDTVIPYLIKTTGVWVGTEIAAEVYTQGNSY